MGAQPLVPCSKCGHEYPFQDDLCPSCGWSSEHPATEPAPATHYGDWKPWGPIDGTLERIEAIEARQRAADMHDPDCRLDEILGKWKQSDPERFTGGFFTTITHESGIRVATDSRFPHLEDPETVLRRALKNDALTDENDEWIHPCDCWLQETK